MDDSTQIYKGRLGRTTKTSVLISSASGPVFPAAVYTGVSVSEDPELGDAILSGSLNTIDCPFDSGRTYTLAVPVRYHDETRHVFALLIPEHLRHEEFKHRSELLQELAKERDVLPDYVRHFHTVFDPAQLSGLASSATAQPSGGDDEGDEKTQVIDLASLDTGGRDSIDAERAALEERQTELEAESSRIADAQTRLTTELAEFEVSRGQLGEVSSRLERERERMDELEMNIVADREELEAARIELATKRAALEAERSTIDTERAEIATARATVEAMRINLEQERHRKESGEDEILQEATQVVTEDQFIEVLSEESSAHHETPFPADASEDDLDAHNPTQVTQLPGLESIHPPATFDRSAAGGTGRLVDVRPEGVLAACVATPKKVADIVDAEPSLMVQFSEVEGYPLVTLLLGALDDDQKLTRSFAWPLDMARVADADVLDALSSSCAIRFAFYNSVGKLLRTWDVIAPLESNASWVARQAKAALGANPSGSFGRASDAYMSSDFERLGSMRHAFNEGSYANLEVVTQIKLAAGIVGYWSGGEVFDYLIGNRSFPLDTFEDIQRRVIDAASAAGIYLNAPLREAAVRFGVDSDEGTLSRRLLANFAELSIGLREHDLDPLEEWENWDALLSLADDLGVRPDDEVVELAEACLRRAQEFQDGPSSEPAEDDEEHDLEEIVDEGEILSEEDDAEEIDDADLIEESQDTPPAMPPAPTLPPSDSFDSLVIAKRSESTGVTYFLPDDAVLDQFEDMSQMPKEDLMLLLEDANGRLEASQMLIERFGAPVVRPVLESSEEMVASEIAALARFLEARADGIEGELVRCVESGGPSATYIASHALVSVRSTSAAPTLIEALQDPKRQGNVEQLARTLSGLGDKLIAPLTRVIKKSGHDDALLTLLRALDIERAGTIDQLAKDRHRKVREAARAAKKSG